ncbi:MAG: DUF3891 family protein [Pleurocapsa minor GSE-CHR-MK-17-07R]|jgi:hypothetical protein|nr:DUF3891 family protein [Pleurocapsa minor GSE-CHR-MK 17-07R]
MIIQSVPADHPENDPRLAITQIDHARSCGPIFRAFGDHGFVKPDPMGLVPFVIEHHDEGWRLLDEAVFIDPRTLLPYHLTETPLHLVLQTSGGSPDFNENKHSFCGLISSMHTYGLFTGRYGLSDFALIDSVPESMKAEVDAVLARELARQKRLRDALAAQPDTAYMASDLFVMYVYKLLQFCDTLALYFQLNSEPLRATHVFPHVPQDAYTDCELLLTPLGERRYHLSPFPFEGDEFEFVFYGRMIQPVKGFVMTAGQHLASSTLRRESVKLVRSAG